MPSAVLPWDLKGLYMRRGGLTTTVLLLRSTLFLVCCCFEKAFVRCTAKYPDSFAEYAQWLEDGMHMGGYNKSHTNRNPGERSPGFLRTHDLD